MREKDQRGLVKIRKKETIVLLAAVPAVLFAGCGSSDEEDSAYDASSIAESGDWEDGVYTETAEGRNGDFEVTVTIEDGVMAEIAVGSNSETEDKGGVAIEELPDAMIEAQTYEVDAVSGATETSDALMDAVAGCLTQASQEE